MPGAKQRQKSHPVKGGGGGAVGGEQVYTQGSETVMHKHMEMMVGSSPTGSYSG